MKKLFPIVALVVITLSTTACGGDITIGYDGNNPTYGKKQHIDYGRTCQDPKPQKVEMQGAPWMGYNLNCREKDGWSLKIKFEGMVESGPISLFLVKKGESVPESLYAKATKDDKWFDTDGRGKMIRIYPPQSVNQARGTNGLEIILLMHGKNTYVSGTLSAEWVMQSTE